MSDRRTTWVLMEVGALFVGVTAAIAAAVQSYLLYQAKDDFLTAILLEKRLEACAGVSSSAVVWGRELDAFVEGANRFPEFVATVMFEEQIERIYQARLGHENELQRLLISAPSDIGDLALQLDDGAENIRFGISREDLTVIDAFTTGLSRRLTNFRSECRSLLTNSREIT